MANGILIGGLLLLLIGSELSMRGAVGLSRQFDLSPLIVGIFVISTVTVLPEFFVVFRAATMDRSELALGGLIGTNIINILFVMGLGALINPMASPPKVVFRDGGALLLATIGLIGCALAGEVSRQAGILLILGFAAYFGVVVVTDWRRAPDHSVPLARALYRSEGEMPSPTASIFLSVLGLIMLALGAHLGVLSCVHFAGDLGWHESIIGLTILAAGMSAPKLASVLVSAARGQTSIAVGHILSAGVFNLLLVLGLIAVIHPIEFPPMLAGKDVFVLAGAAAVLLPLLAMRWRLSRPRGILLMLAYGCYVAFLLWRQGLPLPWGQ
jgi:cation:H+ antiporter